ncbi:MAG: recombination-associated protein RdgC [Aeromonas sp.]
MNFTVLKAASILHAELPSASALAAILAKFPHHEPSPAQAQSAGFVPCPFQHELVTPLAGENYAFCLRLDRKTPPAGVVKRKLAERAAQACTQLGVARLNKAQRLDLKDAVLSELLASTEYVSQFILGFYLPSQQHLLINSPSAGAVDEFTRALLLACRAAERAPLPLRPVVPARLGERLTIQLDRALVQRGQLADSSLQLTDYLKLGHDTGAKRTIASEVLLDHSANTGQLLDEGYQVQQLGLALGDTCGVLNDNFTLRALRYPAADLAADLAAEEQDDPAHCWRQVNAAELLLLAEFISQLQRVLSGAE